MISKVTGFNPSGNFYFKNNNLQNSGQNNFDVKKRALEDAIEGLMSGGDGLRALKYHITHINENDPTMIPCLRLFRNKQLKLREYIEKYEKLRNAGNTEDYIDTSECNEFIYFPSHRIFCDISYRDDLL